MGGLVRRVRCEHDTAGLRRPASVLALGGFLACASLPLVQYAAQAETLREALTAAYQTNPKLDAERAKLRATDEEVPRAQSGYAPTLQGSVDVGHQTNSSTPVSASNGATDPWGYSLTLRQSVFNGFRTTNEVASAEATVREGQENLRQIETNVLLEAVTVYMDVVRDTEIVRMRENNVSVLARDLEAAQTRRDVKEVTKTDVAQARARHARSISATDLAKSNLKVSRANFERVIGHAPAHVGLPGLKLKNMPSSLNDAWAIAEQENPNNGAALFREEAARHIVDRVTGELLPDFSVEASYGHHEEVSSLFSQQDSATVTGRLSVPLYDGGETRARVRQAKHTHVSRLQEIQQVRTETQANVTAAWSRLTAAKAQLISDQIQVDANRLALEGVRAEERVGQRTLLDVLNAEVEYLDAQIQLISTRHDVVVASYQVLATIGQLSAALLDLGTEVYDPEEHLQESRQNWFGIAINHADGRRELYEATDTDNLAPDGAK